MKARLALVLTTTLALAACQGESADPSAATASRPEAVQENLFTLVNEQGLSSAQRSRLSAVRGRPSSVGVNVARASTAPGELMRQGTLLRLAVAPGLSVVARGEHVERRAGNDISWGGPVQGTHGWVQMVLSENGVVGTVTIGTAQYTIEPLGNGLHAVSRLDQNKLPPEHSPENPAGVLDAPLRPTCWPPRPRAAATRWESRR
jgi:hypothetical protein